MAPPRRSGAEAAVLLLLLLTTSSAGAARASSPRVPAVIVFGDSTVDTGNNNQILTPLRANFPPYGRDMPGGPRATGRFGNGRLPPDLISEALGLPPLVPAYLDPAYGIDDFARGVCFASAGTGIDDATAGVLSVIPLWKEVEYYEEYQRRLRARLGPRRAAAVVRGALHVVSIGTNDFLENYFLLATGRFAEFTVPEYEDLLVAGARAFLARIHRLGARRVTFAGLAAIGCLPLERTANALRGGGCVEEFNEVARSYNAKVRDMVRGLRGELPELKLAYVSVYESFLNLIADPAKYGLENVEEGCCATGKFEMGLMCNDDAPLTCDDADKFLFWDAFHPTEKVNRLMANHTLEVCYQEGVL
ncbi:GDSL esterase/lipase [Panicum miliaceum]|uniref:GDSL esterase/lipase n=1 Tax=Panicum miliaceum TaxID=4540 RepID=A0A3L6QHZ7_PANMI|nr:GDSL esterase/lipase [Panicum miliaceum]